jgi:trans-aconitate 2-methyltransferase
MTDTPVWDPAQYNRFEAERDRAALDLLLRLPGDLEPRLIVDLGCGAGQHAALLKRRHPQARVIGAGFECGHAGAGAGAGGGC